MSAPPNGAAKWETWASPFSGYRSVRLVELYLRGRCPRRRTAPPNGRRGHHRSALLIGSLWNVSTTEDRALGAGNRKDGDHSVYLEARCLVPAQVACRESTEWSRTRSGKSVAGRRTRT